MSTFVFEQTPKWTMGICASDKVWCSVSTYLWQTYSEGWSLSLRLSLMCFPCVLERQTQLHFNDTQMLQGFRMHVYVCMCVCVLFFAFDHFSEKPIGATLVVYNYSLRQPHSSSAKLFAFSYISIFVCPWVCMCPRTSIFMQTKLNLRP